MSSDRILHADGVSKRYEIYRRPVDRLMRLINPKRRSPHEEFWALQSLSFTLNRGETMAIIGRNGSGKSTLLQMLAGTLTPTTGAIERRGRVAALLELGAGFNPEFTGIENARLNASLLGLRRDEIDARLDQILAFADLGNFAHQPVKTYSSGMYVRLAFATAINVSADLLIVDEALSVGDFAFQAKCFRKVGEYLEQGGTLLFVSHDLGSVKRLCHRALYLQHGQLMLDGPAGAVCDRYVSDVNREVGMAALDHTPQDANVKQAGIVQSARAAFAQQVAPYRRHSSIRAQIVYAAMKGKQRTDDCYQFEYGESIAVELHLHIFEPCTSLTVACYVRDRMQTDLVGTNSDYEGIELRELSAGSEIVVTFTIPNYLRAGEYAIHALLADHGTTTQSYFDWIDFMLPFRSYDRPGKHAWALMNPGIAVDVRYPGE